MGKAIQPVGNTSGVKAADAEWFSSDLTRDDTTKFRINLAVNAAITVEITKDSGTTWITLNAGSTLVADSEYTFDVGVRAGDTFNMRTSTVGGATVRYCRVDRINTEG